MRILTENARSMLSYKVKNVKNLLIKNNSVFVCTFINIFMGSGKYRQIYECFSWQ